MDEHANAALEGRVCADQIVPHPPGIPALVPGQVITRETVQFLLSLMRSHKRTDLHGVVHDSYTPMHPRDDAGRGGANRAL